MGKSNNTKKEKKINIAKTLPQKTNKTPFKDRLSTLIALLIIGVSLIVSGNYIYNQNDDDTKLIRIVATSDKVPEALANNVRISKLTLNGGSSIEANKPLNSIELTQGWEYNQDHNLLYAYNTTSPAEISFELKKTKSFSVEFVREVGSGIVEIYEGDKLLEEINLYENCNWNNVSYSYKLNYSSFYWINLLAIIISLLGIFIIVKFCVYKNRAKIIASLKALKRITVLKAFLSALICLLTYLLVANSFSSICFDSFKKDSIKVTVEATGEKNVVARDNNVRLSGILRNIENSFTVNDSTLSYDMSKVPLSNGWQYENFHNFLFNYDATAPSKLEFYLDEVRTLDLRFVSERGSGIVNIYINDEFMKTLDLFSVDTWGYKYFHYQINPLVRPFMNYKANFFLFVLFFIISLIIFNSKKEDSEKGFPKTLKALGLIFLSSLFLAVIVELIQLDSIRQLCFWLRLNYQYLFLSFCIIGLLHIMLSMLFKRNHIAFIILSIVLTLFTVANSFKLQFRGSPLLFSDLLLVNSALSVVENFKLKFPFLMILSIIVIIALIVALVKFEKKFIQPLNWRIRILGFIGSLACFIVLFNSRFSSTTGINMFQLEKFYEEQGFINAFLNTSALLKPLDTPEGYSEEKMKEISQRLEPIIKENSDKETPNIIVIMSESFWDLEKVEELKFNEEFLPNYKKLKETAVSGELLTNIFGGGTVNSEFEALTGFSTQYLPEEYIPFQRCINKNFFSINSFLKEQGYVSEFIHPFLATNYNRKAVYKNLNFDKVVWEKDFAEDTHRMRSYVSDKALTERIIADYEAHNKESDKPWFNLSVSMQNHGGFWPDSIDEGNDIDFDASYFEENSIGSIKDFAIGLKHTDIALGELISYFEQQEEPTVIVMFGDHMVDPGSFGSTLLEQAESYTSLSALDNNYERHITPFIAWSNQKDINEDCGVIGVNQLLPTVFDIYDIKAPKYFSYLRSLQETYPACASDICVNPDQSYKPIGEMSPEQKQAYDENWFIIYDYIYGKRYLKDFFEVKK